MDSDEFLAKEKKESMQSSTDKAIAELHNIDRVLANGAKASDGKVEISKLSEAVQNAISHIQKIQHGYSQGAAPSFGLGGGSRFSSNDDEGESSGSDDSK